MNGDSHARRGGDEQRQSGAAGGGHASSVASLPRSTLALCRGSTGTSLTSTGRAPVAPWICARQSAGGSRSSTAMTGAPSLGVAVAVVRRIREVVWIVWGMGLGLVFTLKPGAGPVTAGEGDLGSDPGH